MGSVTSSTASEAHRAEAIRNLSEQFGCDEALVLELWTQQLAVLQQDARIRDYLPIFVFRGTRDQLALQRGVAR